MSRNFSRVYTRLRRFTNEVHESLVSSVNGKTGDITGIQNEPAEGPFQDGDKDAFDALVAGGGSGGGSGDALVDEPLSQFAETTSAQLASVLSDETGTGLAVFSNSPTLIAPALGTPSGLVGTNITGTASGLTAGEATTVPDEAITLAKLAHIGTASFLGRNTAGDGDPEELNKDQVLAMLNVVDGATPDQDLTAINSELAEAAAEIDAIMARDWVKLSDGSKASSDLPSSYPDNVESVTFAFPSSGFPSDLSAIITDRRSSTTYQTCTTKELRFHRGETTPGSNVWSPWIRLADAADVTGLSALLDGKANVIDGNTDNTELPTDSFYIYLGGDLDLFGLCADVTISNLSSGVASLSAGLSSLSIEPLQEIKFSVVDLGGEGLEFLVTSDSYLVAEATTSSRSKATPIDADEVPIVDSTTGGALKKLTWANLKATLKTYFDTLFVDLTTAQTIPGKKTFTSDVIAPNITAIEARDWVLEPLNSITEASPPSDWKDNVLSKMPVGSITDYTTIFDQSFLSGYTLDEPSYWTFMIGSQNAAGYRFETKSASNANYIEYKNPSSTVESVAIEYKSTGTGQLSSIRLGLPGSDAYYSLFFASGQFRINDGGSPYTILVEDTGISNVATQDLKFEFRKLATEIEVKIFSAGVLFSTVTHALPISPLRLLKSIKITGNADDGNGSRYVYNKNLKASSLGSTPGIDPLGAGVADYPEADGIVTVDRRANLGVLSTRRFDSVTGNSFHQASTTPGAWSGEWHKIAIDGNYVDLTTAQIAAGAKTWTGQQQATGQAAVDDDSLMTRSLARTDTMFQDVTRMGTNNWETTFVGSGGINQYESTFRISTGTTTGSSALARGNSGTLFLIAAGNTTSSKITWSQRLRIGFNFSMTQNDANTIMRFQVGETFSKTTISDLDKRGMGLKIVNLDVYALTHDGTTLTTSASLATLPSSSRQAVVMDSDSNGNVSFYLNGSLLVTQTGGPTSNGVANDTAVNFSSQNGAGTKFHQCVLSGDITFQYGS